MEDRDFLPFRRINMRSRNELNGGIWLAQPMKFLNLKVCHRE
jgi:hypothetical protein